MVQQEDRAYSADFTEAVRLRKRGMAGEAITILKSLIEDIHGDQRETEAYAALIHEEGKCLRAQGETERSLELNLEALRIREALGDPENIASTMDSIGLNFWGMGQLDKAFTYLEQALNLHTQTGDKLGEAISLNSIGLVFWRLGKNHDAADSFARAEILFTELDHPEGLANVLNNRALLHEEQEEYSEALVFYNKALSLFHETGNMAGEANSQNNIALLHRSLGDYVKAEQYLDASIALSEQIGAKRTTMLASYGKAQLYLIMKNFEKSDTWFDRAEKMAREQNEGDTLQDLYEYRAYMYEQWGRFEEAYRTLRKYTEERERFLNEEKNTALAEMEVRYKTEQKERDNHLFRERNRELQKANETKLRLFSIISHDLRSSAGSIRQLSNLVKDHGHHMNTDEKEVLYSDIADASQNTLDLLEQLLNWSRGQLDRIELKPCSYNIAVFLEQVLESQYDGIRRKEIDLEVIVDDELEAWFDRETTAVALRNIVSNAVKFTPRHGMIRIRAIPEPEGVAIRVTDSGEGLPPDRITHILEDEIAISSAGTENETGSGLGLSLCRLFMEKNHGRLELRSEPGKGCAASLHLPVAESVPVRETTVC